MKRFTLTLAAIIGLAVAVNAQTYVGDIEFGEGTGFIPSTFTINGHPYVVQFTYTGEYTADISIYQSDFTMHVVDITNVFSRFNLLDVDSHNSYSVCTTQTLFNSDDNFEYIQIENLSAIHIKSSNGSTLWSFNAEEGYLCYCQALKLDNKYYLVVKEYNGEGENSHLYLISQGQGLTKLETELPISVFPSIVNRSQQITVELGEGNNATEVTVINGLGQVIKRMPVEEGQRQVTIPAQELNSGLNVVNTRTQQGQGSCKIIVR